MLRILREIFDGPEPAATDPARPRKDSLQFAAAALLVEVARIDGVMKPAERAAVLRAIHQQFDLAEADAEALLQAAEQEMKEAGGYYPFTSLINRQFTQPQKERLIEMMWRAAYADNELDSQTRAAVETAMVADPELARRVTQHKALRKQLRAAFDNVLDEPPPQRLIDAVRSAPVARRENNVIPLRRKPAPRWS